MINITRIMNPVNRVDHLQEPLFVGEEYAHQFTISPAKDISFLDAAVAVQFVRPDEHVIDPGGYVDTETGDIKVVLSPECYAVSGQYEMYVFAVYQYETLCAYACEGEIKSTTTVG